jgi:hypothetical protein
MSQTPRNRPKRRYWYYRTPRWHEELPAGRPSLSELDVWFALRAYIHAVDTLRLFTRLGIVLTREEAKHISDVRDRFESLYRQLEQDRIQTRSRTQSGPHRSKKTTNRSM